MLRLYRNPKTELFEEYFFERNLRRAPSSLVNLDRCSGFLSIVLQNMHLESVRLIISISKLMFSCFPQNLFLESRSLLPPAQVHTSAVAFDLRFVGSTSAEDLHLQAIGHAERTKKAADLHLPPE